MAILIEFVRRNDVKTGSCKVHGRRKINARLKSSQGARLVRLKTRDLHRILDGSEEFFILCLCLEAGCQGTAGAVSRGNYPASPAQIILR